MPSERPAALSKLALAGFLLTLVVRTVESMPLLGAGRRGLLVAALSALSCLLVLRLLFRAELRSILANRGLLVPIGLVLGASQLISWASLLPLLGGSKALGVAGISLSVSLGLLLSMALWVVFAAWATALVLRVADGRPADAGAAWPEARAALGRVLLAMSIVVVAILVVLALGAAFSTAGPVMLGGVLLGGVLLLNLMTMALLPVVVRSGSKPWGAFLEGVAASWARKGRWLVLIAIQWLLLGAVTRFGSSGRFGGSSKLNFSGKWLGGYEAGPEWYSGSCEFHGVPALPVVELLLMGLFLLLALAVKLRVVALLDRGAASAPERAAGSGGAELGQELV